MRHSWLHCFDHSVWAFLSVLLCLSMTAVSCKDGRLPAEADLSEFRHYVDSLDTLRLSRHLKILIDSDTSSWKADATVRNHYAASVASFDGVPLWFTRMGVSEDADSLLAFLRRELPSSGLDSVAFFVPQIAEDLMVVHQLAFDSLSQDINVVLARLDYRLSKVYVRYTAGMRYGFMRPDRAFNRLMFKPEPDSKDYVRLFDCQVSSPDYGECLRQLCSPGRMPFLYASAPDDSLYLALRKMFSQTSDAKQRATLAVNMERCRWRMPLPEKGEPHVWVNIPSQQLWAVCPDSVLNMRICCGAVTNKTPLLSSKISYMQVNPDWIVPQTIVKADFLRHAGDTDYFDRNRYYIVDRVSGDTLNPAEVDGEEMLTGRLRIGQKGGAGNSLGRIVFRFPNDFGVYLHDTNNREAFKRQRRTLSHGCIRVEKPFELACFLLPSANERTLDRLRLSMDIPPVTDKGKDYLKNHDNDPRPLRLLSYQEVSPKVPVYLNYFTAYPHPATGVVEFFPDLYDYDEVVRKNLRAVLFK